MTPQQRTEVARYLAAFDFSGLFTDPSVGWDWPDSGKPLRVPFQDGFLQLDAVAGKKGVRVLLVPPLADGRIMPSDQRKKLEKAVTPLAAEHLLIFVDKAKTRQVWLWTSRLPGKPVRHRELTWEKGRANELLLQKLTTITFTLDEEDALDITGVVQRLRDNLDRDRLTKRFYDEFKRQKDGFQEFVDGITDSGILAHYTSLMLNRLMFCYFLQQKGFLNGEQDYLRRRFDTVRETLGHDKFHSFYRSFLKRLFHEGFDGEARPAELAALIGPNIPYLNGGIFAEHPIERSHPNIQIPDEAFEKIFRFFDAWQWHLDDRPLGNDKEINPEVLGYVFEKYTNQKEMGAYYTKEDITEYISKNTILPFILQKVADKIPAAAWDLLKEDPDRYIYEPVRRGAGDSPEAWEASLPENIRKGLHPPTLQDTVTASRPIQTLELRKDWNTPTPPSYALPTEIWRETIARHQRCHELREKLRAGEVRGASDLVTLNLNIRQFVQDVIASAPANLALALWKALRSLSVLDPTCGSGAFLFAALEILQELYEGLLERFRVLLADWQSSGEKHPVWQKEITSVLEAVDRHLNEDYFIHKTIIVHNLYGVDIMEEAVEICKLRLFLKLAAQLEPGQQIEPLPDIDFNVRPGNTLVGYASRDELRKGVENDASLTKQLDGLEQGMLAGTTADAAAFTAIMEQAEDADRAFRRFQDRQDSVGQSASEFRSAKESLENILQSLRAQLDRFLAAQYNQKNLKSDAALRKWRDSHQPFHWFVEFYGILNSGGFDVIVGNPPYVEYTRGKLGYTIQSNSLGSCDNLWAFCLERSLNLLSSKGDISLIVPLSLVSTDRFSPALNLLRGGRKSHLLTLSGDAHPSVLFDGVKMSYTIMVASNHASETTMVSKLYRWLAVERPVLFHCFEYAEARIHDKLNVPFKMNRLEHRRVVEKICSHRTNIGDLERTSEYPIVYHRIVRHFVKSFRKVPYFKNERDGEKRSDDYKLLRLPDEDTCQAVRAFLMSSSFYLFFVSLSDAYHCSRDLVLFFPVWTKSMDGKIAKRLQQQGSALEVHLFDKSVRRNIVYKATGLIEYDEFYPRQSKPLIDQIDTILAEHYGFTEEEVDFIINYDIKYRMGLSGGRGEEEE
jgi:hypothetical protein